MPPSWNFLRNGCWTAAESSPWRMKHVRHTDLEQMKKTYGASLISAYIEAFETKTDAQSQKALDYGLEALLAARRNG